MFMKKELLYKKELFLILQEYKILANECRINNYDNKLAELSDKIDSLLFTYDLYSKQYLSFIKLTRILNIFTLGIYGKFNKVDNDLKRDLLEGALLSIKNSNDELIKEIEETKKMKYENELKLDCYEKNCNQISEYLRM